MANLAPTITALDTFLRQPNIEASPAWEFINGQTYQKPMPTLYHSRLQRNLVNWINQHPRDYEAIQELRCLVPPFSPVPDISVIALSRLPESDGPFIGAPDWLIEIRSPDQNTLDLQAKIVHCLSQGTQLAWLIDLQKQQVWAWQGESLPLIYEAQQVLPTLIGIPGLAVVTLMEMTQAQGQERGFSSSG
ncbi:Uma2 family endonuclease [Thermosynechococcaceae cyanobacterium BACA0444]|uniref:Uma2 family endonuclease n=1 Tax=Pseudocalidococcus azoricus BACA0444 TaxID=2918990 RepID=A0AAE4FNF2_9CYAN|nr:Uma2 family endonuclease [Pseudocalidococcus azoricus]MDS3859309.1 Uma2 family endonuclease [Pseudocalidococcus azoricus BACA0444]